MSDLIDRQAAINAIENTDCELSADAWDELTDAIMQLPSAQPEIVRCKDCDYCAAEKSFGKTYYYCDAFSYHAEGDLIGVSLQVSPEHFCGWAERSTNG